MLHESCIHNRTYPHELGFVSMFQGFVTKQDQKLFVDDNVSEISYELPASLDIVPLRLIISDNDLRIGKSS